MQNQEKQGTSQMETAPKSSAGNTDTAMSPTQGSTTSKQSTASNAAAENNPNEPNTNRSTAAKAIAQSKDTKNGNRKNRGKKTKPDSWSSWQVLGNDLTSWIKAHLFSIVVAAVFMIGNVAFMVFSTVHHLHQNGRPSFKIMLMGGLPNSSHSHHFQGQDIVSWIKGILHSALLVRSPLMIVLYTLLIAVILSVAQSRMGALRTVFASLFSAFVGSALGLAVCLAVDMAMRNWQHVEHLPVLLSPLTLIVGALMAESAYESALWRRRILLIGYTTIGTLLLFSGNPGDYCTLGAAVVGQITGLLMHGPISDHIHWSNSTDYEIRRLFAFAQLVLAVGPLLALTSTSHWGPLTTFGLFTSSIWGDSSLLPKCSANPSVTSCLGLVTSKQHLAIAGLWLHMLLPIAALALVAWGLYHGRRLAAWVSIAINGAAVVFAVLYYVVFPFTVTPTNQNLAARYNVMPAFVTTALPPLVLIILTIRELSHFSVPTGLSRIWRGIAAMIGMLLVTSCAYVGFALAAPQDFKPRPTAKLMLFDMLRRLLPTGFGGRKSPTLIVAQTRSATLVSEALTVVFWLTVLIVFILWFRDHVTPDGRDREKAEALVTSGGESMSFMVTWEGNHYWFSPTKRSGIAYRVTHGIALTVTGPFGDPSEYMDDLRAFTAYCDTSGWSPAFYAVHEDQRKKLESLGWSSIQVGTEMVIDPNKWETRGKKWQDIRTAINKAKRDGITDVLTTYDAAGFTIDQQIVEISEQWAQLKALPEMKFTLGGIEELRDDRVALLYAIDSAGEVLGVTSWLPTYRDGRVVGWTLDFMRHRTDSPNGIMEFLIARMAERLRDEGQANPANAVEFMSLSAAPLAGMNEKATTQNNTEEQSKKKQPSKAEITADKDDSAKNTADDKAEQSAQPNDASKDMGTKTFQNETGSEVSASKNVQKSKPTSPTGTEIIEHALQIAADVLEPAYGFKSLFFFKKKFQPSPAPIYICYPDSAKLAQIGFAVVNAYVPELKPKQVVEIMKTMTSTYKQ